MSVINFFFYMWAVIAIVYEFIVFRDTKQMAIIYNNIDDFIKKKPDSELNDKQSALGVCMLLYGIWNIVGLFSSQWVPFLGITILSLIPIKKYVIGLKIDALLTLGILFYIILNKYHWHINTGQVIYNFIKLLL